MKIAILISALYKYYDYDYYYYYYYYVVNRPWLEAVHEFTNVRKLKRPGMLGLRVKHTVRFISFLFFCQPRPQGFSLSPGDEVAKIQDYLGFLYLGRDDSHFVIVRELSKAWCWSSSGGKRLLSINFHRLLFSSVVRAIDIPIASSNHSKKLILFQPYSRCFRIWAGRRVRERNSSYALRGVGKVQNRSGDCLQLRQ